MKLVLTQNVTLDGVIEASEGWIESTFGEEVDISDMIEVTRRQTENEDGLLLGRKTFESFRGYWPHQTNDTTGVSEYLNRTRKYVVSTTMRDPQWENTTILSGDLEEEVRALKEKPGRDLGVTGSISVSRALIAAGLVDEYRLSVYPVVLGRGRRLFEGATDVPKLELLESLPFRSGAVMLTYRPAG